MKKILFVVIAMIMAAGIGAFAMKQKHTDSKLVQKHFIYTAYPSQSSTDLNNPANYSLTGNDGQDVLDCPDGLTYRCGVMADDNGSGQPVLSGATIFLRD